MSEETVGYRVAVLVDSSMSWGRGVVRGIANYAREHGPWCFYFLPRGRYEEVELPPGWTGDGIIARVTSQKLANQLIDTRAPVVNVSTYEYGSGAIPQCTSDEASIGRIAAGHFLDRGFQHFAYCAPFNRPGFHDKVEEQFIAVLADAGFSCHQSAPCFRSFDIGNWHANTEQLGKWLVALPRPLGLLAWNALEAFQVTQACLSKGIHVPEHVAVLSGGYDKLLNAVAIPTLSSFDNAPGTVGYEAASLLHRMMSGEPAPREPVLVETRGIVANQSTDILAIKDPAVKRAVRFIRDNLREEITIKNVVKESRVSRRLLEVRFRDILRRSIAEEIRRVRLETATSLLIDTKLPISVVARSSGFGSADVFSRTFRKSSGYTPLAFRRKMHVGYQVAHKS